MLCVAFSWLVLGAFYGTGYCICTDLHWRVRSEMGKPIHSSSYLQFLVENVTGRSVPVSVLNPLAAVGFTLLLAVSISLNLRDYRSKRMLLRTKEAESLERSARNLRS
jgi:hypothetical protein